MKVRCNQLLKKQHRDKNELNPPNESAKQNCDPPSNISRSNMNIKSVSENNSLESGTINFIDLPTIQVNSFDGNGISRDIFQDDNFEPNKSS